MAGFKTHITTSSICGCFYAGAGYVYGVPLDTAIVGGALCGFAGMLPDLDSDYGVPLRETMAFTAATVPMLLIDRLASLGLRHDEMVLLGVALYLFVRFGVTNMLRKYTVHRGMFHSIPAALTFAGVAFLISGGSELMLRYFKAGGVLIGVMSHLILDEIYSVEWKGGRYRLKKSSGTALKLFGDDMWANLSCYGKLAIVIVAILGEPMVMERLEARNPEFAQRYRELHNQIENNVGSLPEWATNAAGQLTGAAAQLTSPEPTAPQFGEPPSAGFAPGGWDAAGNGNQGAPFGPPPGFGRPPSSPPSDGYYPNRSAPSEAEVRRPYGDPTLRSY